MRSTSRLVARPLLACLLVVASIGLGMSMTASSSDAERPPSVHVLTGCPDIEWLTPKRGSDGRYGFNDPRSAGGCVLQAKGMMRLRLASVVGDMRFAQCEIRFIVRLDDSGVVVVEQLQALGSTPCDDVYACHRADGLLLPMKGHVERGDDNHPVLSLNMCVDTCLGRFAGATTMDLTRHAHGWRLTTRDGRAAFGASGWRFEGDGWNLRSESELDIRTTANP
jgi:hypothetical protein